MISKGVHIPQTSRLHWPARRITNRFFSHFFFIIIIMRPERVYTFFRWTCCPILYNYIYILLIQFAGPLKTL